MLCYDVGRETPSKSVDSQLNSFDTLRHDAPTIAPSTSTSIYTRSSLWIPYFAYTIYK